MKNDKKKVRDIRSYKLPVPKKEEEQDDRAYGEKLREALEADAEETERELGGDMDSSSLGDGSYILNRVIEELEAKGEWDGESYQKAKEEEEKRKEEKEFLRLLEKHKGNLSRETLKEVLSEEDLRTLERGEEAWKEDEKRKKRKKHLRSMGIAAAVVLTLFGMTMNTEANREKILRVWTEITGSGQNIYISKNEADSTEHMEKPPVEADSEEIKEKMGMTVPQLMYMPDDMNYENYEIDFELGYAKMCYGMNKDDYLWIYMSKEGWGVEQAFDVDGEILKEDKVCIDSLEQYVDVQRLQNTEGESNLKVDLIYDNTYYLFLGKMDEKQFEKIINKIFFQ